MHVRYIKDAYEAATDAILYHYECSAIRFQFDSAQCNMLLRKNMIAFISVVLTDSKSLKLLFKALKLAHS